MWREVGPDPCIASRPSNESCTHRIAAARPCRDRGMPATTAPAATPAMGYGDKRGPWYKSAPVRILRLRTRIPLILINRTSSRTRYSPPRAPPPSGRHRSARAGRPHRCRHQRRCCRRYRCRSWCRWCGVLRLFCVIACDIISGAWVFFACASAHKKEEIIYYTNEGRGGTNGYTGMLACAALIGRSWTGFTCSNINTQIRMAKTSTTRRVIHCQKSQNLAPECRFGRALDALSGWILVG